MSSSAVAIANLLYRYAELVDKGNLDGLAPLFTHAKFKIIGSAEPVGAGEAIAMLKAVVKLYPDGTPRTKHLVTNPILDIDEVAGHAACRSSYTVLQATPDVPLQVIAAGRYRDEFRRIGGEWHFVFRDYTLFDFQGHVAGHLQGF